MTKSITIEVPDAMLVEAESTAAELGVGVEVIAFNAFEAYLEGVRHIRLLDLDGTDEPPSASLSTE